MRIPARSMICMVFLFISTPWALALNECDVPAFLNVSPPPNLLIGFDNSGSMYDLAYTNENSFCYDNTYGNSKTYYGYYDNNKKYIYDATLKLFKSTTATYNTSSCTNTLGTDYFCIAKNTKSYIFSGNFLNWLTMSKLDLMKKALTGGKHVNSTLVGESRGCMGRRFVKEVVGSRIAFSILGSVEFGTGGDLGKIYSGGTSRIEIYEAPAGGFNFSACKDVIDCLMGDQQGCLKKNTDTCLGLSQSSNELSSFNHSMHYCWAKGKKESEPSGDGSVQSNQNACKNVYTKNPPILPSQITTSDGSYVCSADFLGKCWNGSGWTSDACVAQELKNYCDMLTTPEIIDPSANLGGPGAYNNAPAILVDSGIVGQMDQAPIDTLFNVKEETTAPTGILHSLKDKANIGLIAYNNYGSRFELANPGNYYYTAAQDKDGAKIFSNVQEGNTEIIGQFNDLTGYAWTPIAELFYEGARYYGGKSSAYGAGSYTSPIASTCQRNLVVFLSDGGSTYDRNLPGSSFTGTGSLVTDPSLNVQTYLGKINEPLQDLQFGGTNYAKAVAYWAHQTDHNSAMDKTQAIDFYTVFTMGGTTGNQLLKDVAKWGGYKDVDGVPGLDTTKGDVYDTKTNGVAGSKTPDGIPDNYFEIRDPDKLASDLKLLLSEILEEQGGAGAVATVTQQVGTGDIIVRGAFKTFDVNPKELSWKGHLESYWPYEGCKDLTSETGCKAIPGCSWNPSASTKCGGKMYSFQHPGNSGKFCSDLTTDKNCWDAESMLPAPASRSIFTVLEGVKESGKSYLAKQNFVSTNTSLCNDTADWLGLTGDALKGTLSLGAACGKLVSWVRGDEPGTTETLWRNRGSWTLGDIVYSTPVVVEQPSLGSVAKSAVGNCGTACSSGCTDSSPDSTCEKECFYCYREVHKYRKKMIYVGANDGMLHAFVAGKWNDSGKTWVFDPAVDSEIGKESWAFIPSNLLPELKDLARSTYGTDACWHRFMVDLSPQARDVFIDADGDGTREWRTVILGGERQGGDVYFALDVTDPDNPRVLWEYSVLRNMVQLEGSTDSKTAVAPYLPLDTYRQVSHFPASWSAPTVGRLTIPDGIELWAWPKAYAPTESTPSPAPYPVAWKNSGTYTLGSWYAFIGGAVRVFDPVNDLPGDTSVSAAVRDARKKATIKPYFLAIDMENGINIFQHLWPMLHQGSTSGLAWADRADPVSVGDPQYIPYAMTAPVSLDINQDGDVDHLYMGDLNGQFYSLRFNLESSAAARGILMDIWPTKVIPTADLASNRFRSERQPIGASPAMAFDRDPATRQYRLRAYFGTGKFDDVVGAKSDKTDTASMSFYNLIVDPSPRALPDLSAGSPALATFSGNSINVGGDPLSQGLSAGGFVVQTNVQTAIPTTTPPTGVTNPYYPHTVLDFGLPGERVVDMALVAGKLVFFLTFVPFSDDCASGGDAYLYILNYTGDALTKDPLKGSGFTKKAAGTAQSALAVGDYAQRGDGKAFVAKVSDSGVPSQPVLDSSNQHVLIQTSDARIHKIKVELDQSPLTVKGWKEEETENP